MKSFIVTMFIILAGLFIIPILYLLTLPPRDITLKDLQSSPNTYNYVKASTDTQNYRQWMEVNLENEQFEYFIILGSFKDPLLAEQKLVELRNKTSKEFFLLDPTPDGYIRISFGKYQSREEAESVRTLVKEEIDPRAWILTVEK